MVKYMVSDFIAKLLYVLISFINYLHNSIIRFIKEEPYKLYYIIISVYTYTKWSTNYQCNELTITGWRIFCFILFNLLVVKYIIADYIIFIIKEQMANYYILPIKNYKI